MTEQSQTPAQELTSEELDNVTGGATDISDLTCRKAGGSFVPGPSSPGATQSIIVVC